MGAEVPQYRTLGVSAAPSAGCGTEGHCAAASLLSGNMKRKIRPPAPIKIPETQKVCCSIFAELQ